MGIKERIRNIATITSEYRRADPPAPKSVKIELTGQCNYRCGYCALTTRAVQPTQPMDKNFFFRVVREMKEIGVEEIGLFFIGESFMAPEFLVEAITFSRELNFENIFLTSNASLAEPERVKKCFEAGLNSLKWSVNNADEKQFCEITSVKGALFHRVIDNITAAKAIRDEVYERTGHRCELALSSILYDGEQRDKMEKLHTKLSPYVDSTYWLPLYSMGSFAIQREKELGFKPTAGNQSLVDSPVAPLPCWSVFTEGHITSRGILSACCFDAHDYWAMADLNKVSFMDGWHSQKFQKLRRAHLNEQVEGTICKECALYS